MRNFLKVFYSLIFLSSSITASCQFYDETDVSLLRVSSKTVVDYFDVITKDATEQVKYACYTDDYPFISTSATKCKTNIEDIEYPRCNEETHLIDNNTCGYYKCGYGYALDGDKCKTDCTIYGYSLEDNKCVKAISYDFYDYYCDAATNKQGFIWELSALATSDGTKIDSSTSNKNTYTLDDIIYSHSTQPQCKRKYQACTMDCPSPLVLEESTSKCVVSYEKMCIEKGMVYNSASGLCEKENQCGNDEAYRELDSQYCMMNANCEIYDGICIESAIKQCENPEFPYSLFYNICTDSTECLENQYVLDDGTCGGTPFCNEYGVETIDGCIDTVFINKSCAPDSRNGNLCYASSGTDTRGSIDYYRPLLKGSANGIFKEAVYGNKIDVLCTNTFDICEFRLTNIYSDNDGKSLCFRDAQGEESCIEITGDCSFTGNISHQNGIKQLKIENGNKIVAYNLQERSESIGFIDSTCTLSGKVGSFNGIYISSDIISIKADGEDIKFWDVYERGFIGIISMIPTIPQVDIDDGFIYEDADVYSLINKGFTGFYSENDSAVYGVYNGFISKTDCQNLITDTSFYIPQAQNIIEEDILQGLSFKSGNTYNYNDGDMLYGSCIIKSESSTAFSEQEFSIKQTFIEEASSIFVCSPFTCENHYCQYNQCLTGYSPTIYDQSYFDLIVAKDFPNALSSEICGSSLCDSNEPYFAYCGNNFGCEVKHNIYQQSDGTCVEVSCRSDETLDPANGKCISYGCVDSIERSGKCYRSLY